MKLTVFHKGAIIARGAKDDVLSAVRGLPPLARSSDLLAFDDESGLQVDLDLDDTVPEDAGTRKRGRPSLGVEAKEVTLLPRHWQWLRRQRGGASSTLRKLVEAAMREQRSELDCHDAAYWFLSVMAGDLPKFEDAVREIYAGNRVGYDHSSQDWPADIRSHGRELAFPA